MSWSARERSYKGKPSTQTDKLGTHEVSPLLYSFKRIFEGGKVRTSANARSSSTVGVGDDCVERSERSRRQISSASASATVVGGGRSRLSSADCSELRSEMLEAGSTTVSTALPLIAVGSSRTFTRSDGGGSSGGSSCVSPSDCACGVAGVCGGVGDGATGDGDVLVAVTASEAALALEMALRRAKVSGSRVGNSSR